MSPNERKSIDGLTRSFVAATGSPLFVPPTLYAMLERQGVDLANVRPTQPVSTR